MNEINNKVNTKKIDEYICILHLHLRLHMKNVRGLDSKYGSNSCFKLDEVTENDSIQKNLMNEIKSKALKFKLRKQTKEIPAILKNDLNAILSNTDIFKIILSHLEFKSIIGMLSISKLFNRAISHSTHWIQLDPNLESIKSNPISFGNQSRLEAYLNNYVLKENWQLGLFSIKVNSFAEVRDSITG